MSPVTHFLASWMVANVGKLSRRERAAVTIAGVIPDIDGVGAIAQVLTLHSDHPLMWFSRYHHLLHNLTFAVLVAAVCFAIARQRWKTALLALFAFHLHLFCDLIGARGPDGYDWPIPYLLPFSRAWDLSWSGQWGLNAWPNFAITGVLLVAAFVLAWRNGYSPLEMVSQRADRAFVAALRQRFPRSAVHPS